MTEREKVYKIRESLPTWYKVRIVRIKSDSWNWIRGSSRCYGDPQVTIGIPAEKHMSNFHWSIAASYLLHEAGHMAGTDFERQAWSNGAKIMRKVKIFPMAFKVLKADCLRLYQKRAPHLL